MRLAIPTDDQLNISAHAGRSSGWIIFDIEGRLSRKVEFRLLNAPHTHDHSHGDHAESSGRHQELLKLLHDCDSVMVSAMGPRLMADLQAAGIRIVLTYETDLTKAVEAFARGELITDQPRALCRH
jgi:predicted Fe-Mo cluster-binding NifX family protein